MMKQQDENSGERFEMRPLLIDTDAVAKAVTCSRRHIERLDATGRMPRPIKLGRAKRWRFSEISDWIDAGCPERKLWEDRYEDN